MIIKSKICGVCDSKTLDYIINHNYPPQFVGFIVNYPKSRRNLDLEKLEKILTKKKNSLYVAVLVKPNNDILEKIKHLPFDYYQLYDCTPSEALLIKNKYNKKIIIAFTVENSKDVKKYDLYKDVADIYFNKEVMIAGNIQINDELEKFKKIADIIDISGGLETSGLKDISKIEIFLNKINKLNNEA